jgi:hypothetical protein
MQEQLKPHVLHLLLHHEIFLDTSVTVFAAGSAGILLPFPAGLWSVEPGEISFTMWFYPTSWLATKSTIASLFNMFTIFRDIHPGSGTAMTIALSAGGQPLYFAFPSGALVNPVDASDLSTAKTLKKY